MKLMVEQQIIKK